MADSTAVSACTVTRRSKVCAPRPPASRWPNLSRTAPSTRFRSPSGAPTTRSAASSRVARTPSPPGTSPTPVRPSESVSTTRLRVKNGACAPLRLSSMESRPATGTTRIAVTTGVFAEGGIGLPYLLRGRSVAGEGAVDPPPGLLRVAVAQHRRQQRLRHVLVGDRAQEPVDGGGAHRRAARVGGGRERAAVHQRAPHLHPGRPGGEP